jgi:hypothetical protein
MQIYSKHSFIHSQEHEFKLSFPPFKHFFNPHDLIVVVVVVKACVDEHLPHKTLNISRYL